MCLNQLRKKTEKIQTEKAKIITVLAQHLYIMCTLSKDQIKNITAFWKAIIGFISPEHKQFVKKIKVSYSTCVREAQKRHTEIQARHLEMFRDCYYFSLALDTAQFGRDNFLSCVARFGFDDHISQEIIIFEKVGGTKGQELGRLVFDRLEEKV